MGMAILPMVTYHIHGIGSPRMSTSSIPPAPED